FEDKHKTVYIKKLEQFLWLTLWNLIGERLDIRLIGAETGENIFSVPVHALHSDVAEFIDVFHTVLVQVILPPYGRPFTKLLAKYMDNLSRASGIDPDRWEGDPGKLPVLWAKQVKGKSAPALIDTYLRETPFTRFFNTSLP